MTRTDSFVVGTLVLGTLLRLAMLVLRVTSDSSLRGVETDFGAVLGGVAVGLAAVNVFGGFLVTQRMLEMFRKKAPRVEKK